MSESLAPIVLVDGSSYLFRAFYALPPLKNQAGFPTGAISGFAQMMHKLFQDYPDSAIIVFFDAKGPTHRQEWYADYKKNRLSPPEDLCQQIEPIKKIVRALGLPLISYVGTEADDLIACVAKEYQKHGTVIICSPDKDFCQIVSEKIIVENPVDKKRLTPNAVFEKYGVCVEQTPDYFALIGDSSDNIPGVPKIGPKTAQKLISSYGSLEGLFENLMDLKGVVAQNLEQHKEDAFLSRRLFRFQEQDSLFWPEEIPHDAWPSQFIVNTLELAPLYEEYDLRRLLARLPERNRENMSYTSVSLQDSDWSPKDNYIFLAVLGDDAWEIGFIMQNGAWAEGIISLAEKRELFLSHPDWIGLFWNCKKALKTSAFFPRQYQDVWLIAHILEADKKWSWDSVRSEYPIEMSSVRVLHHLFYKWIDKLTPAQKNLLETIEFPLISILADMETVGVLVDHHKLEVLDAEWNRILEVLSQEIYLITGKEFNLNSAKQLREVLFQERGLKSKVKTPKGEASTNEEALIELQDQDPMIPKILGYRHYEKLRSTYTAAWLDRLQGGMDRLHTTYDQGGTVTGRLASQDPNLQNIPVRSEEGRLIRRTIIPSFGKKIVSFDYSQIELRLMAHFSQDPTLIAAYETGLDLHAQTASILFHIPMDVVTIEQRAVAKTVNFGLIYGMSAYGLSKQLSISHSEATQLIDRYFANYQGVLEYMNMTRSLGKQQGYVETLLGRRIPIRPAIQKGGADNSWRAAINGPLQGTASELIKRSMIDLQPWVQQHPGTHLIMQVHDELVFEVPVEYLPRWSMRAKEIMEAAFTLRVPLVVNYSEGDCWE